MYKWAWHFGIVPSMGDSLTVKVRYGAKNSIYAYKSYF
jgi:hypothetical protein